MKASLIEIENVSVSYRQYSSASRSIKTDLLRGSQSNGEERLALQDISFNVKEGEVVGVIGRNGAGKSTLTRLIMGIVRPIRGRVITRGTTVGILQLGGGLNFDLTGRENIKFVNMLRGYDDDFNTAAEEIAEWAGLGKSIDDPLRTYSSGMLARFSFALETSHKPDILIIDEVLSVGDFEFQQKSASRMQNLIKSDATVILVTHDPQAIREFCNRCIWIDKGKLMYDGMPDVALDHYLNS
jgi:ABC-type polysaccharide/polyol phosphate transport system ATPase subunit